MERGSQTIPDPLTIEVPCDHQFQKSVADVAGKELVVMAMARSLSGALAGNSISHTMLQES